MNLKGNRIFLITLILAFLSSGCTSKSDGSQNVWDDYSDDSIEDFYMVIMSDPQLQWTHCQDNRDSTLCRKELELEKSLWADPDQDSKTRLSKKYNSEIVKVIKEIQAYLGSRFKGVIINGDLTEYGDQDSNLSDFEGIYYNQGLKIYPGLGNHDYKNPVNNCTPNTCAGNMLEFLAGKVRELGIPLGDVTRDYSQFDYHYWDVNTVYSEHYDGSFSYSWDIGNVHFVQLNNYPSYNNKWNAWGGLYWYSVTSSETWLKNNLDEAYNQGKAIILNWHEPDGVFDSSIADKYGVTAVFAGHLHNESGIYRRVGNNIPVFLTGAAHFGTFHVVRFYEGNLYIWQMKVDPFDNWKLKQSQLGYNDDSSYNLVDKSVLKDIAVATYELDLSRYNPRPDYTQSRTITGPFGRWGRNSFCPANSYVSGFKQKVEHNQGDRDDTALNAVSFLCSDASGGSLSYITPWEGIWGDWSNAAECGSGVFMTGVKLKIEKDQGEGDDTAANALQGECSGTGEISASNDAKWGNWTEWISCGAGEAICGLAVQYEPDQGGGDDTGMNGIKILCCTVKFLAGIK